jgi:hypothetical protein
VFNPVFKEASWVTAAASGAAVLFAQMHSPGDKVTRQALLL